MQPVRTSLKLFNILLILTLLGGLVLSACDGQFSLDLNLDGGGGEGQPANSTLFVLMIVLFVVVVALVVARR